MRAFCVLFIGLARAALAQAPCPLAIAAACPGGACTASAARYTCTWSAAGRFLPASIVGLANVRVTASGAAGGKQLGPTRAQSQAGGAIISGTFASAPALPLAIFPGGAGGSSAQGVGNSAGDRNAVRTVAGGAGGASTAPSGLFAGGAGGDAQTIGQFLTINSGPGGGAASFVASSATPNVPIFCAGGGGGTAGYNEATSGGAANMLSIPGGTPSGANNGAASSGDQGGPSATVAGAPGGAASLTAGGKGGDGSARPSGSGSDGAGGGGGGCGLVAQSAPGSSGGGGGAPTFGQFGIFVGSSGAGGSSLVSTALFVSIVTDSAQPPPSNDNSDDSTGLANPNANFGAGAVRISFDATTSTALSSRRQRRRDLRRRRAARAQ